MHVGALGPATLGFGLGVAVLWAVRTFSVEQLIRKLGEMLHRLIGRHEFKAICADELQWSRNQLHQDRVTYFMKPLFHNTGTDEVAMLVRYPAGQINPSHVHMTGHGMYVLSGSLVTHRGTFGPRTFVWFPPREAMYHGAGPDEDLVALFIVKGGLRTDYVGHR
jgi:quercetin dioxygenase-like cupin family protein